MTLSSRISSLTGPDRAVDAEVAVALGYEVKYHRNEPTPYYQPVPEYSWRSVLEYTASLDAAMSASKPDWAIGFMWDQGERTAHAAVGPNAHAGFPLGQASVQHLNRETASALALLAAALKARGL